MERPVLGPIDPVTGRPLYLPHDVVSGTEATGLEPIPPRTHPMRHPLRGGVD